MKLKRKVYGMKGSKMRDYTEIIVLLDRSGSMATIKYSMESAFSEFLQDHKKNPSTKLTLVQFNTNNDQEVIHSAAPIESVGKLVIEPSGGTPLLDAMCKTIDNVGHRYSYMPESERPSKVLMIIITDGEENSSKTYTRNDVNRRVSTQTNHYKWEFIYLGANQDAIKEAASLGIERSRAIRWMDVNRMMPVLSANTVAYTKSGGSSASLNFSDDDRKTVDDTYTTKVGG